MLTPIQEHVTRRNGTEPPFQNAYWDNKRSGLYLCIVSRQPLFSSRDKFDSGTGWPSFTNPVQPGVLDEVIDRSHGMERVEVRSIPGKSHLGHVFPDGPGPGGMRYCINSAALDFVPEEELDAAQSALFEMTGAENPFPKAHIEALWAPWRVEYFDAGHRTGVDFLSEAAETSDDRAHLVVARRASAFLIMNKYPYSAGHLMAVPNRKVADPAALEDGEILDLWKLCSLAQELLSKVVLAQGFNIGFNIGRISGAGVESHLHLHIVPRWAGDSNFIAVIGGTRIIPEALVPLYDRLVAVRSEIDHVPETHCHPSTEICRKSRTAHGMPNA